MNYVRDIQISEHIEFIKDILGDDLEVRIEAQAIADEYEVDVDSIIARF